MTRKLSIGAVVTVVASCVGYFAGAWVIIYALRPEHPEIAPSRLFHEAVSHAPFLILALTVFQLLAFACAAGRTTRLSSSYLASIAAEVSFAKTRHPARSGTLRLVAQRRTRSGSIQSHLASCRFRQTERRTLRASLGSVGKSFLSTTCISLDMDLSPLIFPLANHALQRTRRERRGCNRCVPWAGSLSFCR
jgi:hypothetical protein